jgi:hypothetical protein
MAKDTGDHHYLIEDQEIRETYGPIIGLVAHSHWWSVDELPGRFNQALGAPGWCPNAWQVNALKISCILRVTDAAHLDERRSPSFLRVLRQPSSGSDVYWQFQEHLLQPMLAYGWLKFTTRRPFKISEASSWWICFDTLQMVDRELKQVDALLAYHPTCCPEFQAKAVMKVEKPESLAELIKTEDWLPVDAKIRVSDVASLATNIGGRQLYGDESWVPLRELVQNAVDALRARHLLENRPKDWGQVRVSLGQDDSGDWLEVEDTGLGMSMEVMTGPLVDFGTSYWGSYLMRREHPGLLGKGFQPIGQYGIGFFSVFMVGDRVKVTTRRYDHAQRDTHVLEFGAGLPLRPVLRRAQQSEWLIDGGTRIRVWLKKTPSGSGGLLSSRRNEGRSLESLCIHLFPALPVNLSVADGGVDTKRVITADDWITIPSTELRKRIDRIRDKSRPAPINKNIRLLRKNIRLLRDSTGETVGRACIDPDGGTKRGGEYGIVTIGGIRAAQVRGIVGILAGASLRATRDAAIPVVPPCELALWATEQAELAAKSFKRDEEKRVVAGLVRAFGGDTRLLPVAYGASGWMSAAEVKAFAESYDEVLITSDYELRYPSDSKSIVNINENVLIIDTDSFQYLLRDSDYSENRWPQSHVLGPANENSVRQNSIKALIIDALAAGWGTDVEEVLRASSKRETGKDKQLLVGERDGKEVKAFVEGFKKPKR